MILVGSQRGGGRNLAAHLLSPENDSVEVHEVRGFAADDLPGAFQEAHAMSKGTRCRQYLFSLSFNPPPRERVHTAIFEDAIARAEERLGLGNQPRVVVFHEKEGRRHAHVVWSRIDTQEMKAVQLSFTHRKLQELSRELYLEQGWKMPKGLADQSRSDPRNFTLDEWQQAKRHGQDPRAIKTALQDAWAVSDNRKALVQALKERGFTLARGDRRAFLAVDRDGEFYALPKWAGVKTKTVRERLGDWDDLPALEVARARVANEMRPALDRWQQELAQRHSDLKAQYVTDRNALIARQHAERKTLFDQIEARRVRETQERQEQFRKGIAGLWDRLRGEHKRLREAHERQAYEALLRDRQEKDGLIFAQLESRRALDDRHKENVARMQEQTRSLAEDRARFEAQAQPARTPEPSSDAVRRRSFMEERREGLQEPDRFQGQHVQHER